MSESIPTPRENWSTVEAVRKRPGMYVGGVERSGLTTYVLGSIQLLLALRPTRLAFVQNDGGFVVEADGVLPIEETTEGTLLPFEDIRSFADAPSYQGTILNALSERLTVEIRRGAETETLAFRRGERESRATVAASGDSGTTLGFAPDVSIFKVAEVPPPVLQGYFRRLGFLHAGLRLSVSVGGETRNHHAPRGILDLFDAVSAPCVPLHDPIHFVAEDGPLRIETVFAYQNRHEGEPVCFINGGRAFLGGTHERGVRDALDRLHRLWELPKASKPYRNGVVGVVSVRYPNVVWEGCVRDRVGNPELRGMVRDLFVRGASKWLQGRPDVADELKRLRCSVDLEAWIW